MSEVTFKVDFGSNQRRTLRGHLGPGFRAPGKTDAAHDECAPHAERPPTRAARLLALAYYVERQVEAGAIKDYAEAARILGMSRARMTQVMALRWLPRQPQEEILLGAKFVTERLLRGTLGRPTGS